MCVCVCVCMWPDTPGWFASVFATVSVVFPVRLSVYHHRSLHVLYAIRARLHELHVVRQRWQCRGEGVGE